jgi:hypothetical protein
MIVNCGMKKRIYSICAMNFQYFSPLHNLTWFPNWQLKTRRRSKTLNRSQRWGRAKFAENLRAFPFNKDLSNETTFRLINLAGQYQCLKDSKRTIRTKKEQTRTAGPRDQIWKGYRISSGKGNRKYNSVQKSMELKLKRYFHIILL